MGCRESTGVGVGVGVHGVGGVGLRCRGSDMSWYACGHLLGHTGECAVEGGAKGGLVGVGCMDCRWYRHAWAWRVGVVCVMGSRDLHRVHHVAMGGVDSMGEAVRGGGGGRRRGCGGRRRSGGL